IVCADILRASADHDSQFSFKIGLMLGKRYFDHAVMCQQRARRLKPNQWRADFSAFHLRNVIRIVQSDRDQFRWRDWNIDLQTRERQYFARWLNLKPVRL